MSRISLKRLDEIIVSNWRKFNYARLLAITAILILILVKIKVAPSWFDWIATVFLLASIYISCTRLEFLLFQRKIGKWLLHRYIVPPNCCGTGFWEGDQVVDWQEREFNVSYEPPTCFLYFTLDGVNYPVTSIQKVVENISVVLDILWHLCLLPFLRKIMKKS